MTKEHKDIIDDWLLYLNGLNSEFHLKQEYCKRNNLPDQQGNPPGFATVQALLVNFELVKNNPTGTWDTADILTPFGKDMADAGGWDAFFKMEARFKREFEADREMMNAVNTSTIEQHQLAKDMHNFQRKSTNRTIAIGAIVALATLTQVGLAVFTFYKQQSESESIKKAPPTTSMQQPKALQDSVKNQKKPDPSSTQ